MVKRKPDPLQDIISKSYETAKAAKVYCALCGQEIIWMADKPRQLYLQEMAIGIHQDCAQKLYYRGNQHK